MAFKRTLLAAILCAAATGIYVSAGCESPCLTEEACRTQFRLMDVEEYYNGSGEDGIDIHTKGCFLKKENVFWGPGGTDEEIVATDLPGVQVRVCCDGSSDGGASLAVAAAMTSAGRRRLTQSLPVLLGALLVGIMP